MAPVFGQIVIGPPGSGKTTYCDAMSQLLKNLGRPVALVNLDPANENVPYKADVDMSDLIGLEEVMEHLNLGPNGGLIYCLEYLELNWDWLLSRLEPLRDKYLIIDFPGQVELYTHHNAVKNLVASLQKALDARLCAIHLVDSHYCSEASKFIAACLTSLSTMLQLELPHINVLSKADQVEKYGRLDFNIDYYTEVMDLGYLVERGISDDPFVAKFKKLNDAITDLISNYSLVNFIALSVKSKERMLAIKNASDKANGYCFSTLEESRMNRLLAFSHNDFEYTKTQEIREEFMLGSDEEDSLRRAAKESIGNDLDNVDIGPGFQI